MTGFESFYIGKVKIEHPVMLAPMEAVTNSIFRRIVKPFGASLMTTEFCSSMGLLYGRDKVWDMVRFHESERPITIQIFGSDPVVMSECAKRMEDLGADILDINCGCSVPKMEKCKGGAYLTRDGSLLANVMEAVAKAVKIPVTIKVRKGWDEEHVTCFEIAKMAEALGFSAVTVHGRTSVQAYRGKADWGAIAAVAEQVRIPVIGSGDVTTPEEAAEKLAATRIAGLMIGRAVMGSPWIFSDVLTFLDTGGKRVPVGPEEKMRVALAHLELACQELGDEGGVREVRKHLAWYVRGIHHAAATRAKLETVKSRRDAESLLRFAFL